MYQVNNGCFQTGKAEIIGRTLHFRPWQRKQGRVTLFGGFVKMDTARIRHSHRAGGFVKGFTGGIVTGSADDLHHGIIRDFYNVAVSAGYH